MRIKPRMNSLQPDLLARKLFAFHALCQFAYFCCRYECVFHSHNIISSYKGWMPTGYLNHCQREYENIGGEAAATHTHTYTHTNWEEGRGRSGERGRLRHTERDRERERERGVEFGGGDMRPRENGRLGEGKERYWEKQRSGRGGGEGEKRERGGGGGGQRGNRERGTDRQTEETEKYNAGKEH